MRTRLLIPFCVALLSALVGCERPEAPKGDSKSARAAYERRVKVHNAGQRVVGVVNQKIAAAEKTIERWSDKAHRMKDEVVRQVDETRTDLEQTASKMAEAADALQRNTEQVVGGTSEMLAQWGGAKAEPTPTPRAPSAAPHF